MCGRYALYGPRKRSRAEHQYFEGLFDFPPSYNVAPTRVMPIACVVDGAVGLTPARWGLKGIAKKISAHGEKINIWGDYRVPYRAGRRCLVSACGFFEWENRPDGKQPYYFLSPEGELLAFAGLWEQWEQADGQVLTTCTIVTTEPNDFVRRFHDRMPVVLDEKDYDHWLTADDPQALLKACHNKALTNYPVSRRVNNVRNDDPSLIEPLQ